jgi:hypothetical protein
MPAFDLRSQIAWGPKMTSAAELDRSHHLHPFTSMPGLLRDGATVIRRGHDSNA